jgi:hypothetical protein
MHLRLAAIQVSSDADMTAPSKDQNMGGAESLVRDDH